MLIDFLEKNELEAELITFYDETTLEDAIAQLRIPKGNAVKIDYYLTKSNSGVLIIYPIGSHIDVPKIKSLFHFSDLSIPTDEQIFNATGYHRGFIPPVSIYGVKVILEKSLESKNYLLCRVSKNEFLKISPQEIAEFNEDYCSGNIIKHF